MSTAPRSAAVRRDWGEDDSDAGILHVDMDAFFAAVELRRRPSLRGRPVVVAGRDRGVTVSATYEARALGIRAAMPVAQARRIAPRAVFVEAHLEDYRQESAAVMGILREVTAIVEQVSVDEAYLDVTGARRRLGSPVRIAEQIRHRVREERELSCSVGVASSKVVAKLASTHSKPDGLMLVPRSAEISFLHALDVGAVPGVGAKTADELARRGVLTVAQLAQSTPEALQAWLGVQGRQLYDLAWGRDRRPVEPHREEKSIGTETTFPHDVREPALLDGALVEQSEKCGSKLRSRGLVARTVVIKVRSADFTTLSRSRTLPSPTSSSSEILAAARALFASVALRGRAIRLLGVRVEGLASRQDVGEHVSLAEAVAEPAHAVGGVDQMADEVRARFGSSSLQRAGALPPGAATVRTRESGIS